MVCMVAGIATSGFSQQWMQYKASVLPSQTGADALNLTSLSQDSPGPNFEEAIISDPDIANNGLLRYVQPDTNSTKMYRFNKPWAGTDLTIVARLRGLDDWQTLGLDRLFDIQYRNGTSGFRDALRINYADSSVYLDRSPTPDYKTGLDLTEWHIYRVAVYGDSSVVYIDENPTPVMTGVSTSSTGDIYMKIGDGSGDKVGSILDWIALDTTGAYSPMASPLDPAEFTGLGGDPVTPDWRMYPATVLPGETGGEAFDLTSLSQNSPGPNFVEAIVPDPDIPANYLLRYEQPDTNATKMYRTFFEDSVGVAWTGQNFTLVARIRGLDNWQELGLDRIFDLQYRNGNAGARDALRMNYADSSIYLDRSPTPDFKTGADLTEWHIYRIAVFGDSSVVYFDEDPTPVMTGVSTSGTGDLYLKIGDGSGDKVGGLVDWVAMDVTGAYSPTNTPLDSTMFTGVGTPRSIGDVVFITRTDLKDGSGTYGDSLYVDALHKSAYRVNVPPYSDYASVDSAETEVLKAADLVIIGRGVSSGDFDDADDVVWEELETPILMMSNYVARSNRLRWFPSNSALYAARFGTLQAQVETPADTTFTGVDVSSGVIDYATDYISFIAVDQPEIVNGKILMTITNGPEGYIVNTGNGTVTDTIQLSDYNGNLLMARFAPGDSMYIGTSTPAAVPGGWRTFLTAGDDHEYDTLQSRRLNIFYVLSDDMNQVFLNEVDYLIRGPIKDFQNVSIEQEIANLDFSVTAFPNPFEEKVTLSLTLQRNAEVAIQLYSLDGRVILSKGLGMIAQGEMEIPIDTQELPAGTYVYRVIVGQDALFGKILKN